MKSFDREENLKEAKMELLFSGKQATEENIEKKYEEKYAYWLSKQLNTLLHPDGDIDEASMLFKICKKIPSKYYTIVLQWMNNESICYNGDYFCFEDIYNECKKENLNTCEELLSLVKCIECYFEQEKDLQLLEVVTDNNILKAKENFKHSVFLIYFRD